MRIRVVNLKGTSSYFTKLLFTIVVLVTLAMAGKFIHGKTNGTINTNSRFKLNSTKLPKILNKEITIFDLISQKSSKKSSKNETLKTNTKFSNQSKYSKSIINSEFELLKVAKSKKFDINTSKEEDNNVANEENQDNSEIMQEDELRFINRNAAKY